MQALQLHIKLIPRNLFVFLAAEKFGVNTKDSTIEGVGEGSDMDCGEKVQNNPDINNKTK